MAALTPAFLCHTFCSHPLVCPFLFVLFHSFPPICHVESTCRQSRTQCGTVVYLNSLMGFMGFAVVLEHWFKASSICQFNKPEAREHINTLPVTPSQVYLWSHFDFEWPDKTVMSDCVQFLCFSYSLRCFLYFIIIARQSITKVKCSVSHFYYWSFYDFYDFFQNHKNWISSQTSSQEWNFKTK